MTSENSQDSQHAWFVKNNPLSAWVECRASTPGAVRFQRTEECNANSPLAAETDARASVGEDCVEAEIYAYCVPRHQLTSLQRFAILMSAMDPHPEVTATELIESIRQDALTALKEESPPADRENPQSFAVAYVPVDPVSGPLWSGTIESLDERKVRGVTHKPLYFSAEERYADRDHLSIDNVKRLVEALSWMGYSTPEGLEMCSIKSPSLQIDLINSVLESKKRIQTEYAQERAQEEAENAARSAYEREMSDPATCKCRACLRDKVTPEGMPVLAGVFVACPMCHNKRCPKAENHLFACTDSNEAGQVGVLESPV